MKNSELMTKAYNNRGHWLTEIKSLADKGQLTPSALNQSMEVHHVSRNLNTVLVKRGVMSKEGGLWRWVTTLTVEQVQQNAKGWIAAYDKSLKKLREIAIEKEKAQKKRERELKKQEKLQSAGGGATSSSNSAFRIAA